MTGFIFNAEQRSAWDRDGCVIVRKLFDDDDIAILRGAIESVPALRDSLRTAATPRARPRAWRCGTTSATAPTAWQRARG